MARGELKQNQIAEYTRIAYYYYREGATQEQISERMNISRQRVNRILNACLEYGIVEISIKNLDSIHLELESRIKQKYDLLDIRIVDNANEADIYRDLGSAAGHYLASILQDSDIIGFTRGRTLAAMAEYMPAVHKKMLTVVQMLGSRNQEPQNTAANEIVHNFSQKIGARNCMLFAPIFVGSAELKESLYQDPIFSESYHMIQSCNISVAGIGTAESIGFFASLTGTKEVDMTELQKGQVITGEIGTHLFDQNGASISNRYRNRVIAIELNDYFQIPVRIGVAGLAKKVNAIRAALLGKYINVLVVDLNTARLLDTMEIPR